MLATAIPWERCWIGCKVRTLLEDTVGAMLDRLRSQWCIQGDTEAEVDRMNGNTLAALVVERAELDRDTVAAAGREGSGWDGWKHGGAAGGASRDTVHGAAGRERGRWDGREHGGSAGSGESGAG